MDKDIKQYFLPAGCRVQNFPVFLLGSEVANDCFTVEGYQVLLSRQANNGFCYTTNPEYFHLLSDRDSVLFLWQ